MLIYIHLVTWFCFFSLSWRAFYKQIFLRFSCIPKKNTCPQLELVVTSHILWWGKLWFLAHWGGIVASTFGALDWIGGILIHGWFLFLAFDGDRWWKWLSCRCWWSCLVVWWRLLQWCIMFFQIWWSHYSCCGYQLVNFSFPSYHTERDLLCMPLEHSIVLGLYFIEAFFSWYLIEMFGGGDSLFYVDDHV